LTLKQLAEIPFPPFFHGDLFGWGQEGRSGPETFIREEPESLVPTIVELA
jgi:hypothetical protein